MVISHWVVLRGGRRVWRSVEHILTDGGCGGGGGVLRRGHLQQAVCGVLQRYVVKLPATSTTGGVGVCQSSKLESKEKQVTVQLMYVNAPLDFTTKAFN
ncbi:hypothetical protein E2C01_031138 [Portunus trituberculatus]|uniref:Uncharacterized protein n=1 Tax=Portunus trituberculatus TaxID=210409 RepID=A0A5B7ESR1_PORTR|nr:hypothetical protein [Portunus trituberculatus]